MGNYVFKDSGARKAIVTDLDTCQLVEAGAGSGKTRSLVERMVALIRENKCTVDKIAAVTFTRKAAAELKEKFQLCLERELAREKNKDVRDRLNRALNDLDRCFLGTIHSFCATLLRERPVEAGLDPDFREIEELEDALLCEQAWEDYLNRVHVENPQALADLNKIDVKPEDLKDIYKMLSGYPDVEVERQDLPAPDLKPAREALKTLLDRAEKLLPAAVPQKGWDGLQSLLRRALWWRRIFNLEDDLIFLRLLTILDKKGWVTYNRWSSKEDASEIKDAFDSFRDGFVLPVLQSWREHRHRFIIDFVLPAVELYGKQRLERLRLNFQDLLIRAAAMLRDNPEVRRYFQERYTHILVDEFQDTDPIQAEIMFYLTGQDACEKDWRRLVPRPGSLFVVGDPKQSIYRFRRADIDTYNEVKKLIEEGGGRVLQLTSNFRSVQAIADWVNPVFQEILPSEATSSQAAFSGLDPVRGNGKGNAAGVRIIKIPGVPRHAQEKIASIDASRIARWIRWALDGGLTLDRTAEEIEAGLTERPRPADFMILLRYKSYMDVYARALEEQGIPFRIAGSGGFSGSPEIAELLKIFKALLDPDDPVRLVAVLRGSLFGFSDNQLWLFRKAGRHFNIYSDLPGGLDDDLREMFQWAFDRLKTFREWVQKLPASAALERIIQELGVLPCALTGELGRSRAGHLVQCLEFLAAAEREGITTLVELVDYLALLVETGVEEEINIAPWDDDAVRLMNLHKAKGLEAPVVFLANPGKNVSWEPAVHINRTCGVPRGYFVVEKKKGNTSEILSQPLDWNKYAPIEKQYLEAEEKRLLYVAATRARNLLVVSVYPDKPESSPWHPFSGHFAGVPELEEVQAGTHQRAGVAGAEITVQDLYEARAGFPGPASSINVPSYSVTSVTALSKEGVQGPERHSTGLGQSWGRVIHRVLESSVKKAPVNLELFIENVLAEEGRAPEEKEQVLKLVKRIMQSTIWRRMLRSKKRFVEVPFSVKVEEEKQDFKGGTIVSGIIDLVFLEDGGWVIVDYKTDTVENKEGLANLVEYYRAQVEMYRRFWEEIAKEKVYEAGLYFTHADRWVVVS
ncbi:MAG TPA: UvrD-helicase domain-containing protein [Bacillota bacterium]|nr:UvrD-helicase domain-containing protein [Peptococcaceae bacterium MAG4]NLW38826.1 UvrD-helicase domain-containing protein [Peptococcaceae bacterium]HPZ43889.1 UvrD-helicase domain-containing protein [Bacillota bacterium]HUM59066.1 UvrD-helicase domain-containing protein [Bacillota bacterium]